MSTPSYAVQHFRARVEQFKWCRKFAARKHKGLETDPTLPGFDLFVIHVDADVAKTKHRDCNEAVEIAATDLPPLPCSRPCPPTADASDEIRKLLFGVARSFGARTKNRALRPIKGN